MISVDRLLCWDNRLDRFNYNFPVNFNRESDVGYNIQPYIVCSKNFFHITIVTLYLRLISLLK